MNIKIDISVCRVCLQANPGTNIYTADILEKFLFTTLVQAEKNDGLPEIICKKCLARLRVAYEFKKQAEASDQHIRGFIQDVNKKFQQVTGSSASMKNVVKKENIDDASIDSFDELDEDMQMLINDEQESTTYVNFANNLHDVGKQTLARDQLVEILGENGTIASQVSQQRLIDDTYNTPPQNMEVLIVGEEEDLEEEDEEVELQREIIMEDTEAEEFDQNATSVAGETDEPQFLDEEYENDAEIYEFITDKHHIEKRDIATKSQKNALKMEQTHGSDSSKANLENYCERCNKSFSTRTNLTRHLLTHDGLKPYQCSVCGNSFTQNGSLKSHMFIHTGERPYQCTECPKAFTQSKSLVFHMRRHTGEKPFPCEHCGVRFRQKDGLKRHIVAKHTERKDENEIYICDVCNKILLSKYSLKVHRNKHSEQDLSAAQKKKTTKRQRRVRSEKGTASKRLDSNATDDKSTDETEEFEEAYVCEYCDETFPQAYELIEHRETHAEAHDKQSDSE